MVILGLLCLVLAAWLLKESVSVALAVSPVEDDYADLLIQVAVVAVLAAGGIVLAGIGLGALGVLP